MKICAVILAIAVLTPSGIACAQSLKQLRPGLWEIQYTGEDSRSAAEQQKMAERLKNMPPEKRAQMEAYIKEHGVGVTAGPGGAPMMTMRVCLTPQDIADESGQSFTKGMKQNSNCTTKILGIYASICARFSGSMFFSRSAIFGLLGTRAAVISGILDLPETGFALLEGLSVAGSAKRNGQKRKYDVRKSHAELPFTLPGRRVGGIANAPPGAR